MAYTSRTMWARLNSANSFARHVRRAGTYRSIADDVERELAKIDRDYRRRRIDIEVKAGCSHTRIWQLATGRATTVNETLAIAIERALGVPEGDLFSPMVMHDARTNKPAA